MIESGQLRKIIDLIVLAVMFAVSVAGQDIVAEHSVSDVSSQMIRQAHTEIIKEEK